MSNKLRKEAGLAPRQGESVRVVVRVRPLGDKERRERREVVADVDSENATIALYNPAAGPSEPPKQFTFDMTYGEGSQQKDIYQRTAAPIVESVIEGFNGTIFAYGQTGAGKSFTMEGKSDPPELRGIIPNSFKHIFDTINSADASADTQYLVRASYLEIYNEEIRDLLGRDPRQRLELKESVDSGVYVKDLTAVPVKSVPEIEHVLSAGHKNRSTGATLMNIESSRSHSIFIIVIESAGTGMTKKEQHIRVGKLNLVDLAGSERQSKTAAEGDRLKEAIKINQSLSALGNVISALTNPKATHIPYRDSKLTRLLQDSLGGNTKTVMIANCGPADYNYDETLSTLRYANRAKNIKNKPKINEDPKDAMLREFQDEILRLRAQLEAEGGPSGSPSRAGGEGKESDPRVVEKVVERVVVERDEEAEARLRELEEQSKREEGEIQKKSKEEAEKLRKAHEETLQAKEELAERLRREEEERERARQQQEALRRKLEAMENKLIVGGKLMDKAAKQESELRRTEMEMEEQRRQELQMARELAEKEDENLMLNEQYSSLQDEVEGNTRKLKKLFTRYQVAAAEVRDLQEEFAKERGDLLDSVKRLSAQVKLKQLVLEHTVPPRYLEKMSERATWDEDSDSWIIYGAEHAGNNVRKPGEQGQSSHRQKSRRRPESGHPAGKKASKSKARSGDEATPLRDAMTLHNPYLVYDSSQPTGYAPAAGAEAVDERTRAEYAIRNAGRGDSARGERPKSGRRRRKRGDSARTGK